jgi:HD-GYP domain-containing protein (c-di-GMP phosphodiesterase class II)
VNDSPSCPQPNSNSVEEYFPLDANELLGKEASKFPIYLYNEERKRFVLFKSADESIPHDRLDAITKEGKRSVFVPRSHGTELSMMLSDNLAGIVNDNSIPVEEKTVRIQSLSIAVMQNLFDANADSEVFVGASKKVSDSVADLMLNEPDAVSQLTTLRKYDYYTFSHSMNVCVLALGLYQFMNPNESADSIRDISRGMLLHDIGKCDVPTDLTNKKGSLSPDEWDVMKSHTVKGYERLAVDIELSGDARTVSLMHHEACDGSGYPTGKPLQHIPFNSRLCKVVDVYDALTSRRSYKSSLKPFEALQMMASEMNKQIDQEILKQFILFLDQVSKSHVRNK